MTRLASRFGAANLIRRDRPLTREELFRVVPSVFSEDKHESRSERYTYVPFAAGSSENIRRTVTYVERYRGRQAVCPPKR